MSETKNTFSEPEIVTTEDLKHRSYITFYFNGERIREYHAKCINQDINPNRSKTIQEKQQLLKKLQFEIHKALDTNNYPQTQNANKLKAHDQSIEIILPESLTELPALRLLFNAIKTKLRSDLSRTYKRDLKSVYRAFKCFITDNEAQGAIADISISRIELFLSQFGSSGTYYMNKRRNLGVLFSAVGRSIDKPLKAVKETSKRKAKARLHEKYSTEQLRPILNYLKIHYPNLHICCLLTYSAWLRPHEEIRLLTGGDFKNNFSEIHLSGSENKGGKVRVVYVPEYVQAELIPTISSLSRNDNIFSKCPEPFNYSYFNTQWSRAYPKMFEDGLVYENQTIYSFRHTAAVSIYKLTKDVHLLQNLLGHSNIIVTLKYLRGLGELSIGELKTYAPMLE